MTGGPLKQIFFSVIGSQNITFFASVFPSQNISRTDSRSMMDNGCDHKTSFSRTRFYCQSGGETRRGFSPLSSSSLRSQNRLWDWQPEWQRLDSPFAGFQWLLVGSSSSSQLSSQASAWMIKAQGLPSTGETTSDTASRIKLPIAEVLGVWRTINECLSLKYRARSGSIPRCCSHSCGGFCQQAFPFPLPFHLGDLPPPHFSTLGIVTVEVKLFSWGWLLLPSHGSLFYYVLLFVQSG